MTPPTLPRRCALAFLLGFVLLLPVGVAVGRARVAHADPTVALPHRLLALAPPLIPQRLTPGIVSPLVATLLTATALENASADDAALAFEWAAHESGGNPAAVSPDGLDHGLMQLRGAALQGYTPAAVRADPVLAVRLWFRWFNVAQAYCKSSDAVALGAMSTGRCKVVALVRARCTRAGVACAEHYYAIGATP